MTTQSDEAAEALVKAKARAEQARRRAEIAEARAEQVKARAEQAKALAEQAKIRAGHAETRAEHAETRTEYAKTRAEQAETRAEQAETRAELAEARAELAEAIVAKLTEKVVQAPSAVAATAKARETRDPDRRALESLTVRQREVLQLLAAGHNTKQIAARLTISPKTVEYHRMHLMRALNVHNVPGLVRFAVRMGLVPAGL
ncbi:MAG: LuxR C-terminal-related transcriptional regulator [Verrucomicrobiales bacterium]